jgi:DNA-directed RNA polymerase specialized sigma24 family protein
MVDVGAGMELDELKRWLEEHPKDLNKMAVGLWPVQAGIISDEDAVQAGLERIFKTRSYLRLRPGVKVSSWLMKNIKSAALNAADKRSSRERPGFSPVGSEADAGEPHDDALPSIIGPDPDGWTDDDPLFHDHGTEEELEEQ